MTIDSLLQTLPYYLLILSCWGTAGIFVIAVRKKIRPPGWWWVIVAFTALGMAFFLIAVTAAPGGHVTRGAVAGPIRWLQLVAGACWLVWLVRFVVGTVAVQRRGEEAKESPPG